MSTSSGSRTALYRDCNGNGTATERQPNGNWTAIKRQILVRFFKKKHRIFTIQQQLIKTLNIFTRIYLPPYSLNHLRISYCLRSGLSEEISKAIITSLSAKEPILLIGEHGTGLTDKSLLDLIAETGTDLTRWKTEKHFTSWLCLTPGKHQSSKKNKSRNKKGYTKAGQVFRNAACALTK